jgi:hypothetical protein
MLLSSLWRNPRYVFVVGLICFIPGRADAETKFSLADLTAEQRAEFYKQIDSYGLATAYLNACHRPPRIVERLSPIARGCVDEKSFNKVKTMYNSAVLSYSSGYNCAAPGADTLVAKIEQKIEKIVSTARSACQLRSFFHGSFSAFPRP